MAISSNSHTTSPRVYLRRSSAEILHKDFHKMVNRVQKIILFGAKSRKMFLALTLLIPAQAFLYDMITKSVSPQKITGINWDQIDYKGKFKRLCGIKI